MNTDQLPTQSNLSLLAESAGEHQYDSAVITSNSEQAAWQHQAAALGYTNQGNLFDWQKSNIQPAANVAMTGTLLGGIASSIGAYNQYKTPTTGGSQNMNNLTPYLTQYGRGNNSLVR